MSDKPKMEPMFLPGVEGDPKPGPWNDNIRAMQAAGRELRIDASFLEDALASLGVE